MIFKVKFGTMSENLKIREKIVNFDFFQKNIFLILEYTNKKKIPKFQNNSSVFVKMGAVFAKNDFF